MIAAILMICINEISYYEGMGIMCLIGVNATGYENYYHFSSLIINIMIASYIA
jgi:hypothetical protein